MCFHSIFRIRLLVFVMKKELITTTTTTTIKYYMVHGSARTPKNIPTNFICIAYFTLLIFKITFIQICTSNSFSIKVFVLCFHYIIIFFQAILLALLNFFQCHIIWTENCKGNIHTHNEQAIVWHKRSTKFIYIQNDFPLLMHFLSLFNAIQIFYYLWFPFFLLSSFYWAVFHYVRHTTQHSTVVFGWPKTTITHIVID